MGMDFVVKGFQESAGFEFNMSQDGRLDGLGGPDDKHSSIKWTLSHRIQVKEIPGKDRHDITQRTSDVYKRKATGPLWTMSMIQPCVSDQFFRKIKEMVELGGPFTITCSFDAIDMYITDAEFAMEAGYPEKPEETDTGSGIPAMYGVWTIEWREWND